MDRLEFTRGNRDLPARRAMFQITAAGAQPLRAAMLRKERP